MTSLSKPLSSPVESEASKFSSNSMQDSNLDFPFLPADIITEIISRLPVKSLLKFRSVSKSWLSLISSPEFIYSHLRLSANSKNKDDPRHFLMLDFSGEKWIYKECPFTSLLYNSVTEALELGYPIRDASEGFGIRGSCNGLVFLTRNPEYSLLWNPTTRKHKVLPGLTPKWEEYHLTYGFGYDELHDDYKVVSTTYNLNNADEVEVKVYSLKRDSWTSLDYFSEMDDSESLVEVGIFVNGKLHWDTCVRNIISLDLANEKWGKVEKPSYGVGEYEWWISTLGSDLSVYSVDDNRTQFSAWVMKEYGVKESWMKVFTVRYPINHPHFNPAFFMSNKGEMLSEYGPSFIVYNPKDDSFRYPYITNMDEHHQSYFYIESLVCPFSTEATENAAKEGEKILDPKQSSHK